MNKFYFKLLGIILITAILITISTLFYIRLKIENERPQLMHPGYKEFLFYLVKEIGKNPAKDKVEELAENNNLKIQVKSKEFFINSDNEYFTSKKFLSLKRKKTKRYKRRVKERDHFSKEVAVYFDGRVPVGIEFTILKKTYVFIKLPDKNKQIAAKYAITSIILFFLLIAGFFIKKSFVDPLHKLENAINSFSKNIYSKEYVDSSGELQNLFKSFNKMKKEVASHIEEKERLLRDISHDLRSPITRMKVALELMGNSKTKDRILTDVNELSYLVNQILESYNKEIFQLEKINSVEFVNDYVQKHNIPINIITEQIDNFNFNGNLKKLYRVLNNIIDNSFKYAEVEKGIVLNVFKKADLGYFKLSDSNSNIKDETIEKIFQPFFKDDFSRNQSEKTGSGLGLTITKQLIISMGGNINAYKSESKGLTIEFSLPLV